MSEKKDEVNIWVILLVVGAVIGLLIVAMDPSKSGSTSKAKVSTVDVLMTCQGLIEQRGYVGLDWGSVTNRHVFPTGDINVVQKFTAKSAYGLDLPKTVFCKYRVETGMTSYTVE